MKNEKLAVIKINSLNTKIEARVSHTKARGTACGIMNPPAGADAELIEMIAEAFEAEYPNFKTFIWGGKITFFHKGTYSNAIPNTQGFVRFIPIN